MSGAELEPSAAPDVEAIVEGAIDALEAAGLPLVVVIGSYPDEGSATTFGRNGSTETYLSLLSGAIAHQAQIKPADAEAADGGE